MKQLILIVCLLLCFVSASATHLRGGFITYKKDTTQHPNPRKFFFKAVLITDKASQADDPTIEVRMGDGVHKVVPRLSVTSINSAYDRETFLWEYTFAADGTYTVSWNGINRNPNILNVTPPSDQLTLYLATTINVNTLRGFNSSLQFLGPDAIIAQFGQPLNYNLLAYDPDGDSLSYKLRAPLRMEASGQVASVPGYSFPKQLFNCRTADFSANSRFEIAARDGQLAWDSPCRQGDYIFAVAVEEWRNGVRIGEVIYDMQISVYDRPERNLHLSKQQNQTYSPEGYVVAKINKELEIQLNYGDLNPALAPGSQVNHFISELTQVLKVPVSYTTEKSASGTIGKFRFTPTENLIRSRPYFISFYGSSNTGMGYNNLATTSIGLIIRSDQPIISLAGLGNVQKSDNGFFVVSVNKAAKFSIFAEKVDGYALSLTVESPLAANAKQFDFTVRDTTEGKVGELLFQPSEAQLTQDPQPIIFKATYNPARMAGERASFAGNPIVKEMQLQVIVTNQLPTATPEELANATYLIYPNQVQNKFTVQAEKPAILSIYSLQGKLILQRQLQPGTTDVNRPTATSGLYFYTLTTQDRQKTTGKLVLQ
ncbi:T9SS type A sorting domain-containing protein [Pontibacter fetidus]|uniref:T9SS type A sorting domain-containing protein n=1 Tax=Pontibacter fetidus TaxID=2700082 RepID=A0A6B2H6K5_9BACT|nr:T9SS type A sorting domain-containing protein [Pontibacter fetidus]NDK54664.1 T9SS type A sorting domain-containing protein [Pontibacter fetidus]